MKASGLRLRLLLWSAACFAAAGLIAPFVNADIFRNRVRDSLERALQRKVEIGNVHLTLFAGPGFNVDKVIIHEDPKFGLEPFAYVSRLDARVSLRKILVGRFEFSSLRLVEPSVNLARSENGPWNIEPLLARASDAAIPYIQVSGGRINFRSAERKSVFYVSSADVSLAAAEDGFDVYFSGEPARTDRAARGFGSFRGTLAWRPSAPAERQVSLDLEMAPSAIAEIMMLVQGRDVGLHGLVAARARLEGSREILRATGEMRIEDVHRWDLMAEHGRGWNLPFSGRLEMGTGKLDVSTPSLPGAGVQLRIRASDIFTHPHGAAHLIFRNTPAEPLLTAARHVGVRFPAAASASGGAFGVVSYSFPGELEGRVRFTGAGLELSDAPPIRFQQADVLLQGGRFELAPALADVAGNQATLEGSYDSVSGGLQLKISTPELAIDQFRAELSRFTGTADIPLVAQASGGSWSGSVAYKLTPGSTAVWSGSMRLRKTNFKIPGLSDPLAIETVAVALDGARLHMTGLRGKIAGAELTGEYDYDPQLQRPHRFRLRVDELSAAQFEKLLTPALNRRRGFLARTLRLRQRPVPDWLTARHASGTIEARSFEIGGVQLAAVRARVLWDGTSIELTDLEGRLEDSSVAMSGNVELTQDAPRYLLQWRLTNFAWNGGRIDIDGLVRTSGMGVQMLEGMRAEGTFTGRSITLHNENVRSFSGCYDLVLAGGIPRLKLSGIQATLGHESFSGDGGTEPDGRLRMDLAGSHALLHLTGTAWPFELDPATVR